MGLYHIWKTTCEMTEKNGEALAAVWTYSRCSCGYRSVHACMCCCFLLSSWKAPHQSRSVDLLIYTYLFGLRQLSRRCAVQLKWHRCASFACRVPVPVPHCASPVGSVAFRTWVLWKLVYKVTLPPPLPLWPLLLLSNGSHANCCLLRPFPAFSFISSTPPPPSLMRACTSANMTTL